jgi:hypothetical protein
MPNDASARPIRILYYGGAWPTNIGNAFIDLGAIALLREAVPVAQIAFASEMPRWFLRHGRREAKRRIIAQRLGFRLVLEQIAGHQVISNALDVASITRCDLVVFAGMAMCAEFIEINGPTILALSNKGVPILLLGTGALLYSDEERRSYGDFLRKANVIGMVARDEHSYRIFAEFMPHSFSGIDCAFFLPEAYIPFPVTLPPYVVAAFDSLPEQTLNLNGRLLIRAHHDCWWPLRREYTRTDKTFVSDIPFDYLTLYASAEEVHSDRIHACVAALAYGRSAKFYYPSPRGFLFDAVGVANIRDELVVLNMQLVQERKRAQVEFVRKVITTHVAGNPIHGRF